MTFQDGLQDLVDKPVVYSKYIRYFLNKSQSTSYCHFPPNAFIMSQNNVFCSRTTTGGCSWIFAEPSLQGDDAILCFLTVECPSDSLPCREFEPYGIRSTTAPNRSIWPVKPID